MTHSSIHTKIKPYSCENCHQTFSCVGNLIKHRKIRPDTCGAPQFTNKKITKNPEAFSTAMKTEEQQVPSYYEIALLENSENNIEENENIIAMTEEENYIIDHHQYVIMPDNEHLIQEQLETFTQKEADLISVDIVESIQKNEEELDDNLIVVEEEHLENFYEEDDNQSQDEIMVESEEISGECATKNENDEEFEKYFEVNNSDQKFSCRQCPKIYQTRNISIKHLKNDHQIELPNYIYNHMNNRYRTTRKEQKFSCQFCHRKFTSNKLTKKHELNHGVDGKLIFKCSCCQLYFETQSEVESHQNYEHEDRLKCNIDGCSRKFDHPEKLLSHKKYAHTLKNAMRKKYVYYCSLCGRSLRILLLIIPFLQFYIFTGFLLRSQFQYSCCYIRP